MDIMHHVRDSLVLVTYTNWTSNMKRHELIKLDLIPPLTRLCKPEITSRTEEPAFSKWPPKTFEGDDWCRQSGKAGAKETLSAEASLPETFTYDRPRPNYNYRNKNKKQEKQLLTT